MRSRTTTAPTCFLSQVERVATSRAMAMKYSSQLARFGSFMVTSGSSRASSIAWLGTRHERLDPASGAWLLVRVKAKTMLARVAPLSLLWFSQAALAQPVADPHAAAEALLKQLEATPETRALAKDQIKRGR